MPFHHSKVTNSSNNVNKCSGDLLLNPDTERQGYCTPRVLRILVQKALLILDSVINCLTLQKHPRDDLAMTPMKGTVRLVQQAPTLHMPKRPHSRDALAYLLLLRSLNRDFAPALKQHLTAFSKTCRSHQQTEVLPGNPPWTMLQECSGLLHS